MIDKIKNYFSVGDPNWAWRRRIVIGTTLLCWGMFVFAIGWEPDTARMTLILTHASALLSAVIATYIGGAVVDTMNQRRFPTVQPGTNITTITNPTGGIASPGVGQGP